MKKHFLLLLSLALLASSLSAQVRDTAQIGFGSSSNYAYGPIYRSGASSAFDYSRYSYLFTAAELRAAGIAPGAVIRGIAWDKTSTTFTTGNALFQVYMQNVMSSGLGTASWAAISSGATQVYNNSSQLLTTHTGWQYFALSTPFAYSGNELQLSTHWDISAVVGNASNGAINWRFESKNGKAIGAAGTSATDIANLSTLNYGNNRPNIRIIFTPPPIDMGVTAIHAPVSDCGLGNAEIVNVSFRNFGANSFVAIPLKLIVDGVVVGTETVNIVLGALTSASYSFSSLRADLSATGRHVIQVVTTVPNDANRLNDTARAVVYHYPPEADFENGLPIGWINDPNDKGKDWLFDKAAISGPKRDHTGGGLFAWVDDNGPHVDSTNLISSCVDLSGLSNPILEFWFYSDQPDSTTLLYVDVESGGSWTQILGPLGARGEDWVKIQSCLAISDPQTRVRFRAQEVGSGIKSDIAIDDFRIYDAPQEDIGLVEVLLPRQMGCFYGAAEPLVLAFSNFAANAANGVAVSYQVDGGAIVRDTFNMNFNRCGYDTLGLPVSLDFSVLGLKQINIWADLAGDALQTNDSLILLIGNYPASLPVDAGYQAEYCEGDSMVLPRTEPSGGLFMGNANPNSLTGAVDLSSLTPGRFYSYSYTYYPATFYDVRPIPFGLLPLQNPDSLPLSDDDAIEVDLGFNFVFFDKVYSSCQVVGNGYLIFGNEEFTNDATSIPLPGSPNNFIALAMADLNPSDRATGRGVFTETQGIAPNRRFVVHYDSVVHFGGIGYVNGQLILHEGTHIIDMQIDLIQAGPGNILMTQGIENQAGDNGFISRIGTNNQVFSMQNEAFRYTPTPCPITVRDSFLLRADPLVDLGKDTLICDGSDLVLDAGMFSGYLWNDGSNSRSLTAMQSGTYSVTVTDMFGCQDSDTLLFEQPEALAWTLLGKGDMPCPGDSLGYIFASTSGGRPPFTYSWSNGDSTPSLQMLPPGSYSQQITDANGCKLNSPAIQIQALDSLPAAAFSYTTSGGQITFSNLSVNGNLYAWSFGDGSPVVLADSSSHVYAANGSYQVSLIAYNDCGSDTAVQTIMMGSVSIADVLTSQIQLFPNPNQGQFYLQFGELTLHDVKVEILDLQGRKVYENRLGLITGGQKLEMGLAENVANGLYVLRLKSREGEANWKVELNDE